MSAAVWVEELTTNAGLQRVFAARGPGLVAGLLAIAIAAQAALLITSESGSPQAPVTGAGTATATHPVGKPEVNLQTIVDAHLFGIANLRTGNAQDAPQTSLPLVLAGILASTDEKQGAAIIGSTAATAKLVNVGGTMEGGARLHAVYVDRVVLERGGALESLFLPRNYLMTSQSGRAPASASGGFTPMERLQNAANNGTLFSRLVRTTPVTLQNKLLGYRLFPAGGPSSLQAFSKLGLVSGDLLTAVNGTALDDPARSEAVLQTLSSAASASVTVMRNGTPVELNLNLETVAATADAAIQADEQAAAAASRGESIPLPAGRPAFAPGAGAAGRFGPGAGGQGGFGRQGGFGQGGFGQGGAGQGGAGQGRNRRAPVGNGDNSGASRNGGQTQ